MNCSYCNGRGCDCCEEYYDEEISSVDTEALRMFLIEDNRFITEE